MSTHRKELRQAVVHVLTNFGAQPYPTMAEERVFDSKGDPIINVRDQSQLPCITVYTDTEVGHPITNMNSWPLEFVVELVVELSLSSDGQGTTTDAQLEAKLDDFEQQVRDALFEGDGANGLRNMYAKVMGYKALRMGNAENNNRLAMRGIVIEFSYTSRQKCLAQAFPKLAGVSMQTPIGRVDISTGE